MRKGFTLIELMIVIAIIAIIAAIAIPNLLESRITASESSAASSLRSGVFTGQTTFRAAAHNDMDNDNKGEYGHLGHLSGGKDTWGNPVADAETLAGNLELLGEEWDSADVLSGQPSTTNDINGYHFASFLYADSDVVNDQNLTAVEEAEFNNAEIYYCVVAVPVSFNDTGRRSFVLTNGGTVYTAPGTDLYDPAEAGDVDTACLNVLDSDNRTVGCYDNVASATTRENRSPFWNPQ